MSCQDDERDKFYDVPISGSGADGVGRIMGAEEMGYKPLKYEKF